MIVCSPILELNRAIAVSMAESPRQVWRLRSDSWVSRRSKAIICCRASEVTYSKKLGRYEEARAAFEAAAALTGNKRERDLLRRRAAEAAAMSS